MSFAFEASSLCEQRQAVSYLRMPEPSQRKHQDLAVWQAAAAALQRGKVARFAARLAIQVVGEFIDGPGSGAYELEDRPGLAELLEGLRRVRPPIVLVAEAERIAKSIYVQEVVLGAIRKLGARVLECESGRDLTTLTDDPSIVLVRQTLRAIDEFDQHVVPLTRQVARVQEEEAGLLTRMRGRKPFGYHDDEKPIVDRILDLRRKPRGGQRLSYQAIADRLNEDGVPTRTGAPWRASTVRSVAKRNSKTF